MEHCKNNKQAVLCGDVLYEMYVKYTKNQKKYSLSTDEDIIILTNEFVNFASSLTKVIRSKIKNEDLSFIEFYPLWTLAGRSLEIYHKKKLVCVVVELSDRCLPINNLLSSELKENENISFATYNLMLLSLQILMVHYNVQTLFNNNKLTNKENDKIKEIYKDKFNKCNYMFLKMIIMRNEFYEKNSEMLPTDINHPFSEFILDCNGKIVDVFIRDYEKKRKKIIKKKSPVFRFDYRDIRTDELNYSKAEYYERFDSRSKNRIFTFPNMSGFKILNKGHKRIDVTK